MGEVNAPFIENGMNLWTGLLLRSPTSAVTEMVVVVEIQPTLPMLLVLSVSTIAHCTHIDGVWTGWWCERRGRQGSRINERSN